MAVNALINKPIIELKTVLLVLVCSILIKLFTRMSNKTQHVLAYTIRPPLTAGDRGEPSKSILKDVERIFALIEDERHLIAHRLYESVQRRIRQIEDQLPVKKKSRKFKGLLKKENAALTKEQEELQLAKNILKEKESELHKLEVGSACCVCPSRCA